MEQPGIVVTDLSKRYRGSTDLALDDLSLSVYPGEVYGFLGPNGAGKSTTIRLLMNFIRPTSGSASILGKNAVTDAVAVKKSIGYLSSDVSMYEKMTGRQFLDYMNELSPGANQERIRELTQRLKADLEQKIGSLSRGNRQKIGIIQAFMHEPDVLIFDEPTSGLDPLMQEIFYELVGEAKKRGATIFTSSHILSEVQRICDRVGIIRQGRLIAERRIDEMVAEAAQIFDITFAGKAPLPDLRKLKDVRVIGSSGSSVSIHVGGKLAPLFAELARQQVVKIDARNLSLEEVFMHFYQDDKGGQP